MLTAKPLYETFDDHRMTFLGTTYGMGHLFDMYAVKCVVDGLNELIAVPADHESRGPIAMESTLCRTYKEGHPLNVAYHIAKARGLL